MYFRGETVWFGECDGPNTVVMISVYRHTVFRLEVLLGVNQRVAKYTVCYEVQMVIGVMSNCLEKQYGTDAKPVPLFMGVDYSSEESMTVANAPEAQLTI